MQLCHIELIHVRHWNTPKDCKCSEFNAVSAFRKDLMVESVLSLEVVYASRVAHSEHNTEGQFFMNPVFFLGRVEWHDKSMELQHYVPLS